MVITSLLLYMRYCTILVVSSTSKVVSSTGSKVGSQVKNLYVQLECVQLVP